MRAIVLCSLIVFLVAPAALAQQETVYDCSMTMIRAPKEASRLCAGTEAGQVCYGNAPVEIEYQPGISSQPARLGDRLNLSDVVSIHSHAGSAQNGELGIAILKLATGDGSTATLALYGETSLTLLSESAGSPSIPTLSLETSGLTRCSGGSNNLVAQSAEQTPLHLTVNGVSLILDGTAVLSALRGASLSVIIAGGNAQVSAGSTMYSMTAGQQTYIKLGDETGLTAVEAPDVPKEVDRVLTVGIPFNLVPNRIDVLATTPWSDADTLLEAGRPYTVIVGGLMSGWCVPEGCPYFVSPIYGAHMCETGCQLPGWIALTLIGRIAGGEPFMIQSGGRFTPESGGSLELGINDNFFSDNVGAFYALVTTSQPSSSTCYVSATANVNIRRTPATDAELDRALAAGIRAQAIGQLLDEGGFVWWKLSDETWIRSDVVDETGGCDNLPEVSV
jgi:hypothetical protein